MRKKTKLAPSASLPEGSTPVSINPLDQTPKEDVQRLIHEESLHSESCKEESRTGFRMNGGVTHTRKIVGLTGIRELPSKTYSSFGGMLRSEVVLQIFEKEVAFQRFLRDYPQDSRDYSWQRQIHQWIEEGRLSPTSTEKEVVRLAWEDNLLSLKGYDIAIERHLLPLSGSEPETEEQPGHLSKGTEPSEEETEKDSSICSKDTWRWPGLPKSLTCLAEVLESNGGAMKAFEIRAKVEQRENRDSKYFAEVSQLISEYKNDLRWGSWVTMWIDRPRHGYYCLRKPSK